MKKSMMMCVAALVAGVVHADLEKVSLNGLWDFAFAREVALESATVDFTATDKMVVPGCFDLVQKWYAQRGLAHYRRSFVLDADVRNAFLVVKGMGLQAKFYLDGREVKKIALPKNTARKRSSALHLCVGSDILTDAFFQQGRASHGQEVGRRFGSAF